MIGNSSGITNFKDGKIVLIMKNQDAGRTVVVCSIKTGSHPGTEAIEQIRKKVSVRSDSNYSEACLILLN